jgi:hypothetical protein
MRIGWNGGGHHSSLDSIRDAARQASDDGFASFWLSQITGPDAEHPVRDVGRDGSHARVPAGIVPGEEPSMTAPHRIAFDALLAELHGREADLTPQIRERAPRGVMHYLQRFFYDTALSLLPRLRKRIVAGMA